METEYVVACELLDEEDDELSDQPPQDDNAYTLGRVGEHYVVIVYLPKGRYGIASAASVAKNMLRSFESIRIRLMVGIRGGVPSDQHDIRLGDIVVGCPTHKTGGVILYDFGKAIQDQEFKPAGILNSPPTILLNYSNKLSTIHKRKGSHIAESVGTMITRNPRLRKDY